MDKIEKERLLEEKMKDHIVSINVSFTTPTDVKAKNHKEAGKLGEEKVKKIIKKFLESLNDFCDFETSIDYIEDAE